MTTGRITQIHYDSEGWEVDIDGQPLRPVNTSAVVTLVVPVDYLASINPEHPVTLTQPKDTNHAS